MFLLNRLPVTPWPEPDSLGYSTQNAFVAGVSPRDNRTSGVRRKRITDKLIMSEVRTLASYRVDLKLKLGPHDHA